MMLRLARGSGIVVMLAWLAGCSAGRPDFVDLATLERPSSPNTYLACPAGGTAATVDREPPVWDITRDELEAIWLEALAAEPRLERRASEPEAHRHLFVQRTPVLRFPDIVQIAFLEAGNEAGTAAGTEAGTEPGTEPGNEAATLCIYSRSVYGYSDLGRNRARVEDWLARIGP